MIDTAKGMTLQEMKDVSNYMASMEWTEWIQVIETDTVPKTYLRGGLHIVIEGEGDAVAPREEGAGGAELSKHRWTPTELSS